MFPNSDDYGRYCWLWRRKALVLAVWKKKRDGRSAILSQTGGDKCPYGEKSTPRNPHSPTLTFPNTAQPEAALPREWSTPTPQGQNSSHRPKSDQVASSPISPIFYLLSSSVENLDLGQGTGYFFPSCF